LLVIRSDGAQSGIREQARSYRCNWVPVNGYAQSLGFIYEGGGGSHRVFKRKGEPLQLNFQNRNGYIPPYQARQLLAMIEKYADGDEILN